MHEITLSQAVKKAYQAEVILALMQDKQAVHMEDSEVDALIVMLRKLVGEVGGFLGEEEARQEVAHA
ncbi:hypothetical protein [Pantoea stewartii]|uniref:hypothetical protein n=1 Tax=Pantoea stewartii TaxID=66269 RepID=UPI0012447F95|nr:hypothetical protein [Pantoea stewartii]KAB0545389.1 hypothetical protein F7Q90_25075 [Pantoea stewartii subsp. stewartii]